MSEDQVVKMGLGTQMRQATAKLHLVDCLDKAQDHLECYLFCATSRQAGDD
jgi:hypothetical protein